MRNTSGTTDDLDSFESSCVTLTSALIVFLILSLFLNSFFIQTLLNQTTRDLTPLADEEDVPPSYSSLNLRLHSNANSAVRSADANRSTAEE